MKKSKILQFTLALFLISCMGVLNSCSKDDSSGTGEQDEQYELLSEGVFEGAFITADGTETIDGTFEIEGNRYRMVTMMGTMEGNLTKNASSATVNFDEFTGMFVGLAVMQAAINIEDDSANFEGEDTNGNSISGSTQVMSVAESNQMFSDNLAKCSVYFTHNVSGREARITISNGTWLDPLQRFYVNGSTYCNPMYDLWFSIKKDVDSKSSKLFEQESILSPGEFSYPVAGFVLDKETTYQYYVEWDNGETESGDFSTGEGGNQVRVCIGADVTSGPVENETCEPDGAVTDIDGNTYGTIIIGDQEWMQENLNVATYRNGDAIPQIQDAEEWASATTGAWCYYENNSGNGTIYGRLYNWYAVTDSRGLAPEGWHVPNHDEMVEFIGSSTNALAYGYMVPEAWDEPVLEDSNYKCFSALPAGTRKWVYESGDYEFVREEGLFETLVTGWWTTTQYEDINGYGKYLELTSSLIRHTQESKRAGFSVRCIKN